MKGGKSTQVIGYSYPVIPHKADSMQYKLLRLTCPQPLGKLLVFFCERSILSVH
jgi:hypothetical protein